MSSAKRSRREDGSHGGDGPTEEDLVELRDVIIHCDGSVDVLGGLSGDIARDVPVLCEQATDFVMECVTELPVKTPVYAALVGLINARAGEFGQRVVEVTREALGNVLSGDDLSQKVRARLLTRFLVMLSTVGVVQRREVIAYLQSLVAAAGALAKGGAEGWQPRADWLVYVALSALPWCGEVLSKSECSNELEALLDAADAYCKVRTPNLDPASVIVKSEDGNEVDWFMDMCNRLSAARTDARWQILSIPAIAEPFVETLASTTNAHSLGAVVIPEKQFANHAEAVIQYPGRSMLRILDSTFTEGTGNADAWGPLERFVAEEYIIDTIWAFEPGYRRAAVIPVTEQLASLPLPADQPEQCQFMVAETIFAELLAQPQSTFPPVLYHIVIQDLCKIIPTFPPKMAKTVGAMFRAIERMDVAARDRLASWLAHQVSCFDMVWPWSSWKHVIEQPEDAPQRMFVKDVLRKLCQLSFLERVQKSLIEELHPLLPSGTGINAEYVAAAAQEGVFGELQGMLKEKRQGHEVADWINAQGLSQASPDVLLRSLAVATLERGQKCITHHDVLLKRYSTPLRELVEKAGGEVLVDAAAGVWRGHPQMAPIAVQRLLALDLVTPAAVVNWLLQRTAAFGEDDTYEIAASVCDFVSASKEQNIGKRNALLAKLHAAEAEASGAGQAAVDFNAQGRVFDAQQAQAAEASAVEEIAAHEAALADLDAPLERTTALERDTCVNLCGGLVKAASGGASPAVADRILAFVRRHRASLAADADAVLRAAGSKTSAKHAVAAALGVPTK